MVSPASKWLTTNDKSFTRLHASIDKQWRMGKHSDQDEFNLLQHWIVGETQRISDAISVLPDLVGHGDMADLAMRNMQDEIEKLQRGLKECQVQFGDWQSKSSEVSPEIAALPGRVTGLESELKGLMRAVEGAQGQRDAELKEYRQQVDDAVQRGLEPIVQEQKRVHAALSDRIASLEAEASMRAAAADSPVVNPALEALVSDLVAQAVAEQVQAAIDSPVRDAALRREADLGELRETVIALQTQLEQVQLREEQTIKAQAASVDRAIKLEAEVQDLREQLETARSGSLARPTADIQIEAEDTAGAQQDKSHAQPYAGERHARLTARFVIQEILQRFGEPLRAKHGAQKIDEIFDDIAHDAVQRVSQAGGLPSLLARPARSSPSLATHFSVDHLKDGDLHPGARKTESVDDSPDTDGVGLEITLGSPAASRYGDISLSSSPPIAQTVTPSLVTSDADVDAYFTDLAQILGRPIVERCARMDDVIAESQKRFEALLADGKRGRVASLVANYVFPLETDRESPLPSLAPNDTLSPPKAASIIPPTPASTKSIAVAPPSPAPAKSTTSTSPALPSPPKLHKAPSAPSGPATSAPHTGFVARPTESVTSEEASMPSDRRRRSRRSGRGGGEGASPTLSASPAPPASFLAPLPAPPDPATTRRIVAVESRINTLQQHVSAAKSIACNTEAKMTKVKDEMRSLPGIIASRVETRVAAVEKGKKEVLERMERLETGSIKVATHIGSSVKALEGMQTKMQEMENKVTRLAMAAAVSERQARAKDQDAAQMRDAMQAYDREKALRAELEEVKKDMKAMRILFEAHHRQHASKQETMEERLLALEKVQDQQVREPSQLVTRYQVARDAEGSGRVNAYMGGRSPTKRRNAMPPRPEIAQQRQHRLQHLDSLMKRVAEQAASLVESEQEAAPLDTQDEPSQQAAQEAADLHAEPVEEPAPDLPTEHLDVEWKEEEDPHSTKPVDMNRLTSTIDRWRLGTDKLGYTPSSGQPFAVWTPPPALTPSLSSHTAEHPRTPVSGSGVSDAAHRARQALQAGWNASPPPCAPTQGPYSTSRTVTASLSFTIEPQHAVPAQPAVADRRDSDDSPLLVTPRTPHSALPSTPARTSAFETFVRPYIAHRDPSLADPAAPAPALNQGQNRFSLLARLDESSGSLSAGQYRDPASPGDTGSTGSSSDSYRSLLRKARIHAETVVEGAGDKEEAETVMGDEEDESVELGRGGERVEEGAYPDTGRLEGAQDDHASANASRDHAAAPAQMAPSSFLDSLPSNLRDSISGFYAPQSYHSPRWPDPYGFANAFSGLQDPHVDESSFGIGFASTVSLNGTQSKGEGGEAGVYVQYDQEVMPGSWIPELYSKPSDLTGSTGQSHR